MSASTSPQPSSWRPNYVRFVQTILETTGTAASLVTLEITESAFIQDSERTLLVLADLSHLGVQIALDDFGTGYSALSYLKRFPIAIVKIAREFIADVPHDPTSDAIVAAVVQLAHTLQMTVVAEGVETPTQHARVAAIDCDHSQGFLHARPMSITQLCGHLTPPVGPVDHAIRSV